MMLNKIKVLSIPRKDTRCGANVENNFVILALMERLHTPPLPAVLLCGALTTIPCTDS